jgi:hypothetical protein
MVKQTYKYELFGITIFKKNCNLKIQKNLHFQIVDKGMHF